MMVSAFAIKATNAFDRCEKRGRSSPMHSAPGRAALCAQPRMAPIYQTSLRINAQPQSHPSIPLSQVNLGDRLAFGSSELKLARFNRAVLTVSNGILDPETAI